MQKNILLLTGWGATCTIWEWIIPALDGRCQINCVPPSWEQKKEFGSLSELDIYVNNLAKSLHSPVQIIAWSMGGQIAIRLASRYPELVSSICFLSSVPVFVSEDDENEGIDFDWFCAFERDFEKSPLSTLKKFLVLQVKNDEFAKQTLQKIKSESSFDQYDFAECKFGLDLLKINSMDDLLKLTCEKYFIHGDADAVVNINSAVHAANLSNSACYTIQGAGHAPHVSHASQVGDIINRHLRVSH